MDDEIYHKIEVFVNHKLLLIFIIPTFGSNEVNWDKLVNAVCVNTITQTLEAPGSQLAAGLEFFNKYDLLDDSWGNVAMQSDRPAVLLNYCKRHGHNWHEQFFGQTTTCIADLEDRFRSKICAGNVTGHYLIEQFKN